MKSSSRRAVLSQALQALAAVQCIRFSLAAAQAIEVPLATQAERWVAELNMRCKDLRRENLTLVEWQDAIEDLSRRMPLAEFLAQVDFETIQKRLLTLGRGEHFTRADLPGIFPGYERSGSSFFVVTHGDSIPPHAHNNIVTAHTVLDGRFLSRTFTRLEDAPGRMVLRLSTEQRSEAGSVVTTSDDRDNIHWFVAEKGPVFTFQVSVRSPQFHEYANGADADARVYLDMTSWNGNQDSLEVPVIDAARSRNLYGPDMH